MRNQHLFVAGTEGGEQTRGPLDVCQPQGDGPLGQLSHRPLVTLSSLKPTVSLETADVSASGHIIVAYPTAISGDTRENDRY